MIKNFFFLVLTLSTINSQGKAFGPLEYTPMAPEIKQWVDGCKIDQPNDCYNYATFLAQNLKKETASLKYYDKACGLNHGLACFSLGGILIKYKQTRKYGIKKLDKACYLPDSFISPKRSTQKACLLALIVSDHPMLSWTDIFSKYIDRH